MTTWHGVTLDERSADMMDEVARLCSGIIIDPTQGSYSGGVSASAGTHDGGGAIDIAAEDLPQSHRDKIVYEMRRVGWAAWHRTPDQSDWPHHIHGIAVQPGGKGDRGCLSSGAHEQVHDYYEGRNGLASGAPDDGPRDFVGNTWETYLSDNQPEDPEEDDMKPWAVNEGDGWVITDLATYRTGVGDYKVIDDGLLLGAFVLFNAGHPVSPPWIDYLHALEVA
jgi:hypothetical protein